MKKIKKLTAFFLAMIMILSMAMTVSAASTGEVDPNPPADAETTETENGESPQEETVKQDNVLEHEYTAYQIFAGDISKDSSEKESMTAIQWGSNIDGAAFLTALQKKNNFNGSNPFAGIVYDSDHTNRSADAVARVISEWSNDDAFAREFARIADASKTGEGIKKDGELDAGYYLVVDEEKLPNGTVNSVRNLSFLEMVSDGTFHPVSKVDVPTLKKEVKEINDSVEVIDQWGKVADYDINDKVEFKLTGTLPADYSSYDTYKYVFHDTLSAALTLNEDSIVVKVDGTEVDKNTGDVTNYVVAKDSEKAGHFTVTIEDLRKLTTNAASTVTVEYKATLNEDKVVYGGAGNENTAYLEYSNDPNHTGEGTPTGNTPEDKVVVFTYKLIANKVGEDGKTPLEGAKFQLFKYDLATDEYAAVGDEIEGVTTFEFKGIDAGKYKLVETKAPDGYNKAEEMYFVITATLDSTGLKVTELKIESVNDADGKPIVKSDGETPVFTFTGNKDDGSLTSDIVNMQGIVLPSTGGIGTTIFYVLGGILVIGAGMLLVIKKRVNRAQ